jgi:Putative auto-transporter adhesin, head GIN domain
MKNTFKLLVLFTSISLLSCNEQYTGIKGSGNITKEKRNIEESFTAIVSGSGVTVIVAQEPTASVEVETDNNIQQYVTTKVKNGTLYIEVEGSINTDSPINVNIKTPSISSLEASSGSTIHTKNTLKGTSLSLNTSSGGEMEAVIEYEKVNCDASSGSSLTVYGKALFLETSSSSGSDIDAKQLAANEIVADASSGSFTKVKPIIKLKGTASSGSSISYYQVPKTLIKTESSGGSISEN